MHSIGATSATKIELLAQSCVECSKPLRPDDRIMAAYCVSALRGFSSQVELGIIGPAARNFWQHVTCTNPGLSEGKWFMHPDIHHCIRCGNVLNTQDIVNPVFRVDDPNMVNPSDPADRGVSLGDRIYFVHANCKNPSLNKTSDILLSR